MLDVELSQLDSAVSELQAQLCDGLVAADILDLTSGISLAGFNANPAATAMFPLMADQINKMLEGIAYPELNRFFLLDLHSDHSLVVVRSGDDLLATLLIDNTKTTLGVLLGVAIPRALANIDAARR